MMDAVQPINNLEKNRWFHFDVFHHGGRGQRRETSCDSFFGKFVITFPIEIITNCNATIKRLAEERLSFMIGDGLN